MAGSLEQDPIRGVVDIDTFAQYIEDYKHTIIESKPPESQIPPFQLPGRQSHETLTMSGYPWEELPVTLQQILAFQYPAASVDDEKSIYLNIDTNIDGSISFFLNSPSVVPSFTQGLEFYDRYGEIIIPKGLQLLLKDGYYGSKGRWVVVKRTPTSSDIEYVTSEVTIEFDRLTQMETHVPIYIEERFNELLDRQIEDADDVTEIFASNAALNELHDVVRLLERGRERVSWNRTFLSETLFRTDS